MKTPALRTTLLAAALALSCAGARASAPVKPAPPPPDRPGLNPPRVFPPDREKPVEFPYQPQPEKAALMIVTAHPDDEGMFPGLIPYVTRVLKVPMIMVVLTSGDAHPAIKPPGERSLRENEMRRAAWAYGLPNEPIFGRFRDGAAQQTLERNWEIWGGENEAAKFLVQLIRKHRPDVITAMSFDGEYGHPNHAGAALSTTKAFAWASNPEMFPVEPGGPGLWAPKKIYVHNWPTRPVEFNWEIPVPGTGKTCFDFGVEGSRQHVSQGLAEKPFRKKSTKMGLYATTVGLDTKKADMFDNIDLGVYAPKTK